MAPFVLDHSTIFGRRRLTAGSKPGRGPIAWKVPAGALRGRAKLCYAAPISRTAFPKLSTR
jgi:hypothetical protein